MSGTLHHRHPGDGWVECGDHRHWGLHGAAGLFLTRRAPPAPDGTPGAVTDVVLQHRATWSHHGGTWGIPGGAVTPTETPTQGALREAAEEAGLDPAVVRVVGEHVLDHGVWTYTTVLAETIAGARVHVAATDPEGIEVRWVPVAEVSGLDLHPAFGDALPHLLGLLDAAR
ncbi:NUDIX domain-containing protein [Isoptericola croceus]|uniref:NUDIX domain-containing protein n=1 Tax=Isoptericola croceus TaxID=3031406 RepID=UPI0023F8223C|nr:NUDIX hydrolase [Isoptericola croceus]